MEEELGEEYPFQFVRRGTCILYYQLISFTPVKTTRNQDVIRLILIVVNCISQDAL